MDAIALFFVLGFLARLARSDLKLPAQLYEALSIYLLLAIGLKGGMELARQDPLAVLPQASAVIVLGILIPLIAFPILYKLGRFDRFNAAAIAGHYGSVSVVTFAVAVDYLIARDIPYEAYLPLFLVLLEMPGIAVGVLLARLGGNMREVRWGSLLHEIFLGKSMVLLAGGLLIGWAAGPDGLKPLQPFFFDLFKGALCLFLLEMGLVAAGQAGALRSSGLFLAGFALGMPVVSALLGIVLGAAIGLSAGGTLLLATLAASASYIAAPAAMRIAVPEANPGLSITAALVITFPFNLLLGIPLYHRLVSLIHGG
ncbi:sodium-dependent bicarbonate transport family permease [Parazoarcus communis]|mgnify:FL=1|uniref:Sodium-dependent bicarbonate transport family permease n=2 Tax=root TaxID=1 RepID=A0A323V886_9RHOO|nr:sodium-dependent bicarbonate transport family permease [Parazoarcus communis]NMG72299.1 sodium-dependent bicarbonate transport family permease [Parazoarcus communis SWub3 = DSM 12120]PZA16408.1 sodium-dependent bicarbonate transport family permease [Azoarcus communis] [Parazoarcus communis SWub3 = DSM 12120]